MTSKFQLSVVIPNLDRAHRLVRAVLSVRDGCPDADIIIVDDCSQSDLSAEYGWLQDIGVRIFRHEVRRGGCAARNLGVREACGTHVSFLDSDDVWMPGRHDRIRRFYDAPENGRTVLVSGALLHVDGEIRKPHQPPWRPGSSLVEYVYRDMGRVQTSMLTMPVGIARDCPWNEDLRVNQDTDLAMRLERRGIGFHIDPEPGIIKEESIRPGRLTTGSETADLSRAWYRRESAAWSPAARSGYHLQDRVWRLAQSGRRGEAFVALARSLFPPVCLRETARRTLCMIAGPRLYDRLRESYRRRVQVAPGVEAAQQAASLTWQSLDARARNFCVVARAGSRQPRKEPAPTEAEAA